MAILLHPPHRLFAAFALLFFATSLGRGLVAMVEEMEEARAPVRHAEQQYLDPAAVTRRLLGGAGSSPPTCRPAQCGFCVPCQPVLVVINPGRSVPIEYCPENTEHYPQAWRCKCGNKLFMP